MLAVLLCCIGTLQFNQYCQTSTFSERHVISLANMGRATLIVIGKSHQYSLCDNCMCSNSVALFYAEYQSVSGKKDNLVKHNNT